MLSPIDASWATELVLFAVSRETPEPHGVLQGEDWDGAVALGLIVRHGRGRGRGKGRVRGWYRSDNHD